MTTKSSLLSVHREDSDTPYDQARPLTDHLEELRRRVLWGVLTLGVCSIAGYFFVDFFVSQMARTVGPLVFIRPLEAFVVRVRLAVLLGFLFSTPVLLYHVWRYIGVALSVSERRVVAGALPFSYLLFVGGAGLAWFVLIPVGLKFLLTFGTEVVRPFLSVEACFSFAIWLTLGLGVVFQIPVAVAALARWGFVRSAVLGRFRRHAFLGVLVLAAVLTPGPDVVSQLLLAIPTYGLFEISILLAAWLEPK